VVDAVAFVNGAAAGPDARVSRCSIVSHFKLLSAIKYAITNLISWLSVFDFTKTVKQAGDRIFSRASMPKIITVWHNFAKLLYL